MGLEIRPVTPEELNEYVRVASTAVLLPSGNYEAMRPEWTLAAFEDDKLATSYGAWPLTMRFNGDGIPVAGVSFVGTLPMYRRRGYLRKIHEAHFELLHEQGERPIAILLATQAAIYQRYGYAVVSTYNAYNVEPRYLQFSFPQAVPDTFREVSDDEFALLVDLYRRFRADRIGYVHRGREMWNAGVLAPPPSGGKLSKVVYQEDGEPLGYVIYTAEPGPTLYQRLTVRDLVWQTAATYRAIWNYFANMDLASNIVWGRVPPDDPLPHLILEPRMLHSASHDGLLGRIIDVDKALPGRGYDEEGILTFEIVDEMCPWNSGRWKLEVSTAGSSITHTTEKPQLVMSINTLAMLVFGQISASEAARMGRLDVNEDGSLSLWDRVMRTKHRPFCADAF